MNQLEQLKALTTIVADTGDIDSIKKYQPQDATTNPSLVLKAIESGKFDYKLQELSELNLSLPEFIDRIAVEIGDEILKIVPGYVSTEVDARLSFDTEKTIEKARQLIALYEAKGWEKSRILIKIASTWEGIQAAKVLESEGIRCNLTLLFSLCQAKACADVDATLISPFVGRILDWYKKSTGEAYTPETDPGVLSVQSIFDYYKQHGYKTIVMGASFRNIGEIQQLAGCDRLTIAPALLEELKNTQADLPAKLLMPESTTAAPAPVSEVQFRLDMNADAMATEKLAEGIRNFIADQEKLEQLIQSKYF
ncbi:transaldolase [Reinekea marinisedimentorum]|uniref:Transaldolase n=1 Tax=Reinekea marinisedimentorum TaxID=230495 RepID=A0A4R3I8N4_9GAMM|nr:transaldolase [Reinekea marinisedimentorum]TCS42623.1 transaldolase [Reinekea marinisedimentorum]